MFIEPVCEDGDLSMPNVLIKMNIWGKLVTVISLIIVLGIFGAIEINILFNESLYTTKGSLTFYLTIPPKMIRHFPEIHRVGRITYHYSVGDGPAPQFFALSYGSRSQAEIALSHIQEYLQHYGFVTDEREPLTCRVIPYAHMEKQDFFELYICHEEKSKWTNISITYYPE